MPKVNKRDRDILTGALREGAVSVVTHRHSQALPEGLAAHRHLRSLCDAGLLRLDRSVGDKYDPAGELRSVFKVTAEGARQAR